MSTENYHVLNKSASPSSHSAPKIDMNDVEMVFGTPAAPKGRVQPDVHYIATERSNGRDKHPDNTHSGSDTETTASNQPLLEPDKDRPKAPIAGPEIDDLDNARPAVATPFPGIDDGLLEPNNNNNKPDTQNEGEDNSVGGSHETNPTRDDAVGTEDGKWPWPSNDETDYPYDGFGPRFGIDDRPISPMIPGQSIPDVNTYQQKKNLAQGMMDLALLSANANQLRYVLESAESHRYYYPSLALISLSIIFQVAVGVGLIMNSRYNVKDEKDIHKADKINNMTVLGIFLITIVNVFITSFSVLRPPPAFTITNIGNATQQLG